MHILSGGRLRMKKNIYIPDADRQETFELPVSCYLLKHAQGNVLFDTGCHPSIAHDPEPRWGSMAKFMVPISHPDENVVDQLAMLGVTPFDIDLVVNSHFHTDHCGCNEFFKKATIICHAKELEAASKEGAENMGFLSVDWKQPMEIKTFEGQYDVFNDGRIVLLPLPGHTAGMTGALVALDKSGSFLLASDSVAIRENLDKDINPKTTWNPEQSSQSMDQVRKLEALGTTVLFGHDDNQWKSLKKGIEHYA